MSDVKPRYRAICGVLALFIGICLYASVALKPPAAKYCQTGTSYDFFGADCWRVAQNIGNSDSISHYRDRVHPLFSLIAVSSVTLFERLLGCSECSSRIYQLLFGASGLFFFALVLHELNPRPIAVVFPTLLLLCSSASWTVWTRLPETFLFSFFSISLALFLFLRVKGESALIGSGISSFAGTITNGLLGVLLQVFRRGDGASVGATADRKKTVARDVLLTIGAVALLALLQRTIYPSSTLFFDIFGMREESEYVNKDLSQIPWRTLDFFVSPFVLAWPSSPARDFSSLSMLHDLAVNFPQQSRRFIGAAIAMVALVGGPVLYCAVRAIRQRQRDVRLDIGRHGAAIRAIVLFVVFEFVLHQFYGDMPFLYSMQYMPLVLILWMHAVSRRFPRAYPLLTGLLVVLVQEINAPVYAFFAQT